MNRNSGIHLTYDEDGDVLYIEKSREVAARGTEDEEGIVWRYNDANVLIGATVLAFREVWSKDRSRLAGQLSARFQIPIDLARDSVNDAFDARAPSI